jgi:lysophospholipase L1-like esterase
MKYTLAISLILNIFFLYSFFHKPVNHAEETLKWQMKDLHSVLKIDNNDTVFVGNSITQGFPMELFNSSNVKNRGVGWNTTKDILERIDSILKDKPKSVFLMAGINDIMKGLNLDTARKNVTRIINKAQQAGVTIYVQSVLPTNNKAFNDKVKRFNDSLRVDCQRLKVQYIDLGFGETIDGTLTWDGLHLNGKGYLKWRDAVNPGH